MLNNLTIVNNSSLEIAIYLHRMDPRAKIIEPHFIFCCSHILYGTQFIGYTWHWAAFTIGAMFIISSAITFDGSR